MAHILIEYKPDRELIRLPDEFKAQWLDALRSGEYTQGSSWLCSDGSYCCLGVAYAITGAGWHTYNEGSVATDYGRRKLTRSGSLSMLDREDVPPTVWDQLSQPARVCHGSSISDETDVAHLLAYMNDGDRDFEEIASWIEEYL